MAVYAPAGDDNHKKVASLVVPNPGVEAEGSLSAISIDGKAYGLGAAAGARTEEWTFTVENGAETAVVTKHVLVMDHEYDPTGGPGVLAEDGSSLLLEDDVQD